MDKRIDEILKNQEELLTLLKGRFIKPVVDGSDSELCLITILNSFIEVDKSYNTVNYWIEKWRDLDPPERESSSIPFQIRKGYGIILNNDSIDIACNHDQIKKMLKLTDYSYQYSRTLKLHSKYTSDSPKTARFNGVGKSIIRIKL